MGTLSEEILCEVVDVWKELKKRFADAWCYYG